MVTPVLWRLFLTGTSDFGKIKRLSATIAGVGDPVFPTALRLFKLLSFGLHGSGVEKSWKLQFAEQLARFGLHCHKDMSSECIDGHMK